MLRFRRTPFLALLLLAMLTTLASANAKNVILMIADGWCYNHTLAYEFYTGKSAPYRDFEVQLPVSTYSYSGWVSSYPGARKGYDPDMAWVSGENGQLKPNVSYVLHGATDSAASATAMATGVKTINGYVNYAPNQQPLDTIGMLAKQMGKAAGSISSVRWTDATPVVFGGAHSLTRSNLASMGWQILNSDLDVIMGPAHPRFDDNGKPAELSTGPIGGEDCWHKLQTNGYPNTTLVQSVREFRKLANDKNPKGRYVGMPQAYSTLQWGRTAGDKQLVSIETYNKNVPSLGLMSQAALNALSQNKKGFFLMIEGGAIDWANHSNHKGRAIEEMIDFCDAIQDVKDWIKVNGGWKENLLIVTGDHDSGLILGPNGETDIFDTGPGKIPEMKFFTKGHANMLLPLFAQGAGSELFSYYLEHGIDPVRGKWIDNTSIFRVMKHQICN